MTFKLQFGIRRLLALTFGVAMVMAIVVRIAFPQELHGVLMRWILGGYLLFIVGWVVVRGPGIYAKIAGASSRRRDLKQRRAELAQEVVELKRAHNDAAKSSDDANYR